MAIIKVNKTKNYTTISNFHLREKDMSLKAKGLLSLMLSLPEDWDYSVGGLAKLSKDGKDSVTNTLIELERFGYVKRTQCLNDKKQFDGYDYDIYEEPQFEEENPLTGNPLTENPLTGNPLTENPLTGNPLTENPLTGNPLTGNPPQLNTNINKLLINNKEEKYKKEEKTEIPYVEIIDYLNWKTKSHYKYNTNKTRDCIKARWNEGFMLEDFKKVIDNKSKEWLGDPKYENYLRPETLFGNKFEGYLNSKSTKRYLGNKQVKDTPNWYEDYQREVSNLIENNKAKNGEEKDLKELEDFFGVNKEAEK